jgi:hypothetical protein
MNLSAGADSDITTRHLNTTQIQVIDENQTLSTASVTFLDNPNVDLSSVVVTNGNSTIIFTEGVDYLLQPVGNLVRISRTSFGAIADGETVLVDYVFSSDPSFDDAVLRHRYGAEFFLWSALTLSYRYQQADQFILEGPDPVSPADEQIHTALVRYLQPSFETRLSFEDAERASGVSTAQWRAEQTLRRQAGRYLFGSLTGAYVNTRFKEQEQTEELVSLRAHGEYLPWSWFKCSLEGFWENTTGDIRQVVDTGVLARLDLTYRIWRGGVIFSYLDENDQESDNRRTRQTLKVEILRLPW